METKKLNQLLLKTVMDNKLVSKLHYQVDNAVEMMYITPNSEYIVTVPECECFIRLPEKSASGSLIQLFDSGYKNAYDELIYTACTKESPDGERLIQFYGHDYDVYVKESNLQLFGSSKILRACYSFYHDKNKCLSPLYICSNQGGHDRIPVGMVIPVRMVGDM